MGVRAAGDFSRVARIVRQVPRVSRRGADALPGIRCVVRGERPMQRGEPIRARTRTAPPRRDRRRRTTSTRCDSSRSKAACKATAEWTWDALAACSRLTLVSRHRHAPWLPLLLHREAEETQGEDR